MVAVNALTTSAVKVHPENPRPTPIIFDPSFTVIVQLTITDDPVCEYQLPLPYQLVVGKPDSNEFSLTSTAFVLRMILDVWIVMLDAVPCVKSADTVSVKEAVERTRAGVATVAFKLKSVPASQSP